jgi:alpha-tubulin suppressor-like RCC1 family protein
LNDFGQLGNGNKENQSTPQTVLGLSEPITSIVAGNYAHTCAEMASGNLVCWGFNYFGQLGDGTDIDSLSPVVVSSLKEDVISYDLGVFYSCAVTSQEEASCWGYNNRGQIGQGGTAYTAVPLFSGPGSLRFEIIDLGTKHGCGLRADGTVQCWGSNNFGQLGNGFNGDKFASGSPVDVSNLENTVIDIAAGGEHSCAVIANGEVKCWGENEHGQLGDGNFGYNWAVIPVDVINLNATAEVVVAGNRHTCVLTTAGGVKCWGSNEYGQIGNGSSESFEPTPMDVTGLTSGVIALSAGFDHNCAVTTDGAVKCWGYNTFYQLGDGTQNDRNIPIDVTGLASGITDISAGYDHTCALSNSGTVKCWGASADGSLVPSPQDITDPTLEIINLSAGGTTNVCVVTSSGILQCMGGNQFGEVGNGTFEPNSSFIDVESMTGNVESIVCEVGFCCALVANGRMKCW